jgi:serine-type D-Ala-D-Ala carboxypeptidase/endopeptidase
MMGINQFSSMKQLRHYFGLMLGLFLNTGIVAQSQTLSDSVKQVIKEQIKARIDARKMVGTAVAFIENGKVEYFFYGHADTTRSRPIGAKSVFEIGSISKTFTSLLLADMAQQNRLSLQDPAARHLPDSVAIPSFQDQLITLEHLATHTSGLPRMPANFNPKKPTNPYIDYSPTQLFAFLKQYKLSRAPGKYDYSNLAVGLLGYTLCRLNGLSYEEMISQKIAKPLRLKSTTTLNTSPHLTTGHSGTKPVAHWDFDVLAGAGALRSDIRDMVRYAKAQMGLLHTPLDAAIALTHEPRYEVNKTTKIGLGWHILSTNGDEIHWHNGGTGGYRSFMGFSKRSNKAIIILNNAGQSPDDWGVFFFNPTRRLSDAP